MAERFFVITTPKILESDTSVNERFITVSGLCPSTVSNLCFFGFVKKSSGGGWQSSTYYRTVNRSDSAHIASHVNFGTDLFVIAFAMSTPSAVMLIERAQWDEFALLCNKASIATQVHHYSEELRMYYPKSE